MWLFILPLKEKRVEGGIMIHAHATGGLGYYGYEWSNMTSETR